ncbi:TIGR01906 family membrane protein [Brevibacterium samyangense]|uniref:TIGR01906 family membrane protein n=1 Tax=Brevibacterium samyangense TaxID=366888 RepID=UPI0031CF9FD0
MAENESKNPDDLLARRMNSRASAGPESLDETEQFDALAPENEPKTGRGASASSTSGSTSSAASTPSSSAPSSSAEAASPASAGSSSGSEPGAGASSATRRTGTAASNASTAEASATKRVTVTPQVPASERPALFSDEEWALMNGEPVPAKRAGASGSGAPNAGTGATNAGAGSTGATGTSAKDAVTRSFAAGSAGVGAAGAAGAGAAAAVARSVPQKRTTALDVIGIVWTTLAVPFVLAAVAVRAIASGWFLRFEYFWRPGFPADDYGFTTEDRLHYGSYAVDYLHNQDGERYLADVVLPNGVPVFRSEEISHMADVKSLIGLLFLVAIIAAIGAVVFGLVQSRRTGPGIRLGYRFGAILTLVLFGGLGVLAFLGWDSFFTRFHEVFFEDGTWQFYLDDSLIRLFPPTFWVDAGIGVAAIVLVGVVLLFSLSFAGHRGRRAARKAARTER